MEQLLRRLEEVERDAHLTKHRLSTLEQEQLPRRVAALEPVVQRMEHKLDDVAERLEKGLDDVKEAINSQRALQKGVVVAVAAVVGLIQLIPVLKSIL